MQGFSISFIFSNQLLRFYASVKDLTLMWSQSQDLWVLVCTNPHTASVGEEDDLMGDMLLVHGLIHTLTPGFTGPECPSSCRARLHVNPNLGCGCELLTGCLLPSASVLTEITLRPGSLSWGREECTFLIVQSISFPAAGLNLFLSEVLSVRINHLSLYVFVAVATVWLIEFQSVFLDFKAMRKSQRTSRWESEQR